MNRNSVALFVGVRCAFQRLARIHFISRSLPLLASAHFFPAAAFIRTLGIIHCSLSARPPIQLLLPLSTAQLFQTNSQTNFIYSFAWLQPRSSAIRLEFSLICRREIGFCLNNHPREGGKEQILLQS